MMDTKSKGAKVMLGNYSVMSTSYFTHGNEWFRVEFLKNDIRGGLSVVKYIAITTKDNETKFYEFDEPITEYKFVQKVIEKHYLNK